MLRLNPSRCAAFPFVALILAALCAISLTASATAAKVVVAEFIYQSAPFPSCHASTIAETPQGLVASWFGGKDEGDPSVGIWVARKTRDGWSVPQEVANGIQASGDVDRYPTWNPVLHQVPGGVLQLYYKVGPNPRQWWGMLIESGDGGETWSEPRRLPDGILGPIKNKPVLLPSGRLLSGSSSEHQGWRVHFEWSEDQGATWRRTEPINSGDEFGIIQPTIFRQQDGTLIAYSRSRQRQIVQTRSSDQGETWTAPTATTLPNNNSGLDGVTLADGQHALIYNHTTKGRTPLNLAVAADDTFNWQPVLTLESEPGEYSYPAIIQTADGLLHMVYTWKRERIKHVVVDLAAPAAP